MPTVSKSTVTRSGSLYRWLRVAWCCVALLAIWACGPVYIPVPPPGQSVAFTKEAFTDSSGTERTFWIATGPPNPSAGNAVFTVFDQTRNAGVLVGALPDGSYTAPPFEGTEGDTVFVHYQATNGVLSAAFCVLLSEQQPMAPACP
jgi:hypothetical protein